MRRVASPSITDSDDPVSRGRYHQRSRHLLPACLLLEIVKERGFVDTGMTGGPVQGGSGKRIYQEISTQVSVNDDLVIKSLGKQTL